jgi:NADPH:quinone reductase-like Zn-dependent oxidoreductase
VKAIVIRKPGREAAISVEDVETPRPGAGQVLVRLRWAALNRLDIWVKGGLPGAEYPHIMGADGAGHVEETGDAVAGFARGDDVLLDPTMSCGGCEYCLIGEESLCRSIKLLGEGMHGTFAQYIAVPQGNVHRVPEGFPLEESAAFPLTFVTAWRMLVTKAALKKGQWVLIHGVGGGVSVASLLLSVRRGARVIVTSSSDEKLERARALGALHAINYKTQDVEKEVRTITGKRGVDVVVDSVGKATLPIGIRCLARGGKIVTCGATSGSDPVADMARIFWNQLSVLGSTMGNRREFRDMVDAVETHQIHPVIDARFRMEEFPRALARLEEGKQFGKIVLEIP